MSQGKLRIKENNRISAPNNTGKWFKRIISFVLCFCIFFSCSGFSYAVGLDTIISYLTLGDLGLGIISDLRSLFGNSQVDINGASTIGILSLLDQVFSTSYQQHAGGQVDHFDSYLGTGSDPWPVGRASVSIFQYLEDLTYNTAYLPWIKNLLSTIDTDTGNIASRISTTNTRLSSVISGLSSVQVGVETLEPLVRASANSNNTVAVNSVDIASDLDDIRQKLYSGTLMVDNSSDFSYLSNPGKFRCDNIFQNVSSSEFDEGFYLLTSDEYTWSTQGGFLNYLILGNTNTSLRNTLVYDNTLMEYVECLTLDYGGSPWLTAYKLVSGHSYTLNKNGVGSGKRVVPVYYGRVLGMEQVYREYLGYDSYTSLLQSSVSGLDFISGQLDDILDSLPSGSGSSVPSGFFDTVIDLLTPVNFNSYVSSANQVTPSNTAQIVSASSNVRGLLASGSSVPSLFVDLSDDDFFSFFSQDVSDQINGSVSSDIQVLSFLDYD